VKELKGRKLTERDMPQVGASTIASGRDENWCSPLG
jgi:hypothetical protein